MKLIRFTIIKKSNCNILFPNDNTHALLTFKTDKSDEKNKF